MKQLKDNHIYNKLFTEADKYGGGKYQGKGEKGCNYIIKFIYFKQRREILRKIITQGNIYKDNDQNEQDYRPGKRREYSLSKLPEIQAQVFKLYGI